MGGTAALMHARVGSRVLAFGPRVDLRRVHGAYLPAEAKAACTQAVLASLGKLRAGASVAVHVGGDNAVDVEQARLVGARPRVALVRHATFHHNVPQFLEREGRLVPLLKREMLAQLRH